MRGQGRGRRCGYGDAGAGYGSKPYLAELVCESAGRVAELRRKGLRLRSRLLSWSSGHSGAGWPGLEQLQLLAAGHRYRGACDKVEPRAYSKVFDHAGDDDLAGG